jgi:hypothetical protein
MTGMGAADLAGPGTGSKRLINNRLDGPCAAATFRTAAEAAIQLLRTARQLLRRGDGVAYVLIADDVTGTHNHRNGPILRIVSYR